MGLFLEWVKNRKGVELNESWLGTAANWIGSKLRTDPAVLAKRQHESERNEKLWNMRHWLFKHQHGDNSPAPVKPNDPDMAWIQKNLAKLGPLDPNPYSDPNNDPDDIYGYGAGVNPGA